MVEYRAGGSNSSDGGKQWAGTRSKGHQQVNQPCLCGRRQQGELLANTTAVTHGFSQRRNTGQDDIRSMLKHQNPHKNIHYSGVQLYLGDFDFPPTTGSSTKQNLPLVEFPLLYSCSLDSHLCSSKRLRRTHRNINSTMGKWTVGLGAFRNCYFSTSSVLDSRCTGKNTNSLARAK